MKGDAISIVSTNTGPGVLKPAFDNPLEELHFELLTPAGKKVWKGSVPDPLMRRLESEDPDKPGNLRAKLVRLPEAEFTIRVPLLPNADQIEFYRLKPRPRGTPGGPVRQPLSRLPLAAKGGQNQ